MPSGSCSECHRSIPRSEPLCRTRVQISKRHITENAEIALKSERHSTERASEQHFGFDIFASLLNLCGQSCLLLLASAGSAL